MQTVTLTFDNVNTNAVIMFAGLGWLDSCTSGISSWSFDKVTLKPLLPGQVAHAMAISQQSWSHGAACVRAAQDDAQTIRRRLSEPSVP